MDLWVNAKLNEYIKKFSVKFSFSVREQEIFYILITRVVSTEDIANELRISPFTASNHLKSMLRKTKSASKTEMLVSFITTTFSELAFLQIFKKRPKILVVDDDSVVCDLISLNLKNRGLEVFTETDASLVLKKIGEVYPDFVLTDISMPNMNGIELILQVRAHFPNFPIMFAMSIAPENVSESRRAGAACFFDKPVNMDNLFFSIVDHYMESNFDKSRHRRVEADCAVKVNDSFELKIKNIGFGGAFILGEAAELENIPLKVGRNVDLVFSIGSASKPLKAQCEIVWIRQDNRADRPSGFGVKFLKMSDADRDIIQDYVVQNKVKNFSIFGNRARL